jgi:hypothetical protein
VKINQFTDELKALIDKGRRTLAVEDLINALEDAKDELESEAGAADESEKDAD